MSVDSSVAAPFLSVLLLAVRVQVAACFLTILRVSIGPHCL